MLYSKGPLKKKTKGIIIRKKCYISICTRIFSTLGIREHVNAFKFTIAVLGNWQVC